MKDTHFIPIKTKDAIYRIELRDILYGQKNGRKIVLYTAANGALSFYMTIKEAAQYLDGRFLTCHYSYFINMDYIVKMKNQTIYMKGNVQIDLGRETFRRGKLIFLNYLQEKQDKQKRTQN